MNKNRFIKQMRFHEGVKGKVYKDHLGIETIGVGRNLLDRDWETFYPTYL